MAIALTRSTLRSPEQRRAYVHMDNCFREAMTAWVARFPHRTGNAVADDIECDMREQFYMDALRKLEWAYLEFVSYPPPPLP